MFLSLKKKSNQVLPEDKDSHNMYEADYKPIKEVEPTQYDMIFSQKASKPPTVCFKETETGKAPELIVQNFTESNEKSTNTEHHESSTTHIHISDESTSRPMITIQNIQINKINPIDTNNTSNETQYVPKKSEYVKELMRKHYKLSDDDVKGLSRPLTERFKGSTIFAKLTQANQKSKEQSLKNRDMYVNTNLRANLSKEALKHKKTSSISDINVSQGSHTTRNQHSPKNSVNMHNGSISTRRKLSPSSERVQTYNHHKTNEGATMIHESLRSTTESTFKSPGVITEAQELITTDTLKNLGKNYKTVSTYQEKTSIYKHHHKSKSIHYLSSENSLKLYSQPEETKMTGENPPSTRNKSSSKNPQALGRFDLRLDLGNIGQTTRPDSNLGLLSSKSGKASRNETPFNSHREPSEKPTPKFHRDFYMQSQYSQTTRNQLRSPASPKLSSNAIQSQDKKISRADLAHNPVNSNKTTKISYASPPQSQIQSFGRPETRVITNSRVGSGYSLVKMDLNKKTKR